MMDFNKILEEVIQNELLTEMATLDNNIHNINTTSKLQLYKNREFKARHAPRVKVETPSKEFSISVSVFGQPEVKEGDYSKFIKAKDLKEIIKFIEKIRIPILNFWYSNIYYEYELKRDIEFLKNGGDEQDLDPLYLDEMPSKKSK